MIHIGIEIKKTFDKTGMTVSELGRRISISRENVYGIFKRQTIDTGLLIKISKALDYDFFQYYTPLCKEVIELKTELSLFKNMALASLRENKIN